MMPLSKQITTVIAACLAVVTAPAVAGAITLFGSDLLSNPDVTFPNGTPTQNGSSVVFEPSDDFDKLFKLTLFPAGALSGYGSLDLSISVNLTRLTSDWDPHFVLVDGQFRNISVEAGDNSGGEAWAEHFTTDRGDQLDGRTYDAYLFGGAGYPSVGQAMTWNMDFLLGPQSSVEVSFLGGTGSHIWNTALDLDTGLSLMFLRDNDREERYQLNSITISSSAIQGVPEPSAVMLMLCGLAVLGVITLTRRPVAPY